MRKLFLTSFTFRTGSLKFKEQRLCLVRQQEINAGTEKPIKGPLDLNIAYEKMERWFKKTYPNSELKSLVVYPAIDYVDENESFYGNGLGYAEEGDEDKGDNVFDDRTEWERVIDELINRVDPNQIDGSKILSHLKRERTKPELD